MLASTIALGTEPESVGRARHHTTATLGAWGLAHLAQTAELVVSELITNALQSSWSAGSVLPVMMRLQTDGESLSIEVWDATPGRPESRYHADDAEHGRGLVLVESLSKTWGYYPENGGKTVYALLSE